MWAVFFFIAKASSIVVVVLNCYKKLTKLHFGFTKFDATFVQKSSHFTGTILVKVLLVKVRYGKLSNIIQTI